MLRRFKKVKEWGVLLIMALVIGGIGILIWKFLPSTFNDILEDHWTVFGVSLSVIVFISTMGYSLYSSYAHDYCVARTNAETYRIQANSSSGIKRTAYQAIQRKWDDTAAIFQEQGIKRGYFAIWCTLSLLVTPFTLILLLLHADKGLWLIPLVISGYFLIMAMITYVCNLDYECLYKLKWPFRAGIDRKVFDFELNDP